MKAETESETIATKSGIVNQILCNKNIANRNVKM
jgi:hypothetical protein